jgi:rRNA maturation protein Nop10
MTTTTAKTYTERTCWKCGEESLQPAPRDARFAGSKDESLAQLGTEHSICSKCGAKSVSAVQAKRNQAVNRKSRRASIRAANGRSMT